jgi:hypothetical protein
VPNTPAARLFAPHISLPTTSNSVVRSDDRPLGRLSVRIFRCSRSWSVFSGSWTVVCGGGIREKPHERRWKTYPHHSLRSFDAFLKFQNVGCMNLHPLGPLLMSRLLRLSQRVSALELTVGCEHANRRRHAAIVRCTYLVCFPMHSVIHNGWLSSSCRYSDIRRAAS